MGASGPLLPLSPALLPPHYLDGGSWTTSHRAGVGRHWSNIGRQCSVHGRTENSEPATTASPLTSPRPLNLTTKRKKEFL